MPHPADTGFATNKGERKRGTGFSPRAFRRTGASRWGDDFRSLMARGGRKDQTTPLTFYRQNERTRHLKEYEKAMGVRMTEDPKDPAGHA